MALAAVLHTLFSQAMDGVGVHGDGALENVPPPASSLRVKQRTRS